MGWRRTFVDLGIFIPVILAGVLYARNVDALWIYLSIALGFFFALFRRSIYEWLP